jgi:hypothetical protein
MAYRPMPTPKDATHDGLQGIGGDRPPGEPLLESADIIRSKSLHRQ